MTAIRLLKRSLTERKNLFRIALRARVLGVFSTIFATWYGLMKYPAYRWLWHQEIHPCRTQTISRRTECIMQDIPADDDILWETILNREEIKGHLLQYDRDSFRAASDSPPCGHHLKYCQYLPLYLKCFSEKKHSQFGPSSAALCSPDSCVMLAGSTTRYPLPVAVVVCLDIPSPCWVVDNFWLPSIIRSSGVSA